MPTLTNTFEGGSDGVAITVANSGGASGTAFGTVQPTTGNRWQFEADAAIAGTMGTRRILDATSGYLRGDDMSGGTRGGLRRPFTVEVAPATAMVVAQIRTAADALMAELRLNTDRTFRITAGATSVSASASPALTVGQTYWLEMFATAGTTTANGRVEYGIWDSAGTLVHSYDTGATVNTGTAVPQAYRLGGFSTASGYSFDQMDSVQWGAKASGWHGGVGNEAPTVLAGSDQNVASGATVSLTGTAADTDGTIASRQWTFDYPTTGTPTLTGATSANASFVAGAAGSLYILRHTVTDNLGATASDVVEVRVPTSTTTASHLPVDGTGAGTWAKVGGSASDGQALSDASDSTYIESATASGTLQNRRVRLVPLTPRSTLAVVARLALDTAGSVTVKVGLYEGGTVRQEWTQVVTASPTDYTFNVTTPTNIIDWGNLYLDYSVVV